MRFAYGREMTPEDFDGVQYERIFLDNDGTIEQFEEMVRCHLRRGWNDVITIINRHDIPWKTRQKIKQAFGATVEVHKKEGSTGRQIYAPGLRILERPTLPRNGGRAHKNITGLERGGAYGLEVRWSGQPHHEASVCGVAVLAVGAVAVLSPPLHRPYTAVPPPCTRAKNRPKSVVNHRKRNTCAAA